MRARRPTLSPVPRRSVVMFSQVEEEREREARRRGRGAMRRRGAEEAILGHLTGAHR